MNGSVEACKHFKVGDHIGWQQPSANNTAYQNDSVLVVEKWDYYHCNTNKPISSFNDGKTVINLDRPGLFYFISGAPDHCTKGQKLFIRVMGLHQRAESPLSIETPPEVGLAPGPHPSSGLVVAVTLSSVFVALIVAVVTLV
ncbi:early nodulin-like protein 1 [Durio zibethinus]|uniref:Early nodulin-like protein 1 n=1 Tax=Durio zibethinus TaxID=66656 RepID=A0A6P5WXE2_DURZI|nr:early nodulin-like protein 1 [Durio zibethinus]